MATGLAARRVHCDFRKSKLRPRALDVGIKQHNTHYASTALHCTLRMHCARFHGVRGCGSTVPYGNVYNVLHTCTVMRTAY